MTQKTKKLLGLVALGAAAYYFFIKKAKSTGPVAVQDLPPGTVVNLQQQGGAPGLVVDIPAGQGVVLPGSPYASGNVYVSGTRRKGMFI